MSLTPSPPEIHGDAFILVMKQGVTIPVLPEDVLQKFGGIWVPFGGQCLPRGETLDCSYQKTPFLIHINDVEEILNHHFDVIWSSKFVAV